MNNIIISCKCNCGSTLLKYDTKGRSRSYINGHNHKTTPINHRLSNKYLMVYYPIHPKARKDGFVFKHRLVYEDYYNCCLLPWADIHHKDHDPKNNDINNLEAMIDIKHTVLHHIKDKSKWFCLMCNSKTTYITKKGHQSWHNYKDGHICQTCYLRMRRGTI